MFIDRIVCTGQAAFVDDDVERVTIVQIKGRGPMSQQTFAEMSETEFDALIDDYIEREAAGYGEMPAEIFFDLLLERSAARAGQPLNLEVTVVDDHLVITPDREMGDVIVRGNEILVGERRLVFQLAGVAQARGMPTTT